VGTAGDFMTFLETLRTGGGPILTRETVELASRNQVGGLREQEEPGWGFGFVSGVLTDADRAGSPAHPGTLSWGGVYGHSWFQDPVAELSVVGLTKTALEGCTGLFLPMARPLSTPHYLGDHVRNVSLGFLVIRRINRFPDLGLE
jgi:CubicO group peptidase (beta-lactamase class C family)